MRTGQTPVDKLLILAVAVLSAAACDESLPTVPDNSDVSDLCSGADAPAPAAALTGAIVFSKRSRGRGGDSDIYSMSVDGSDPVNLTNHSALDLRPAWSPDGSRIAFERAGPDGGGDSEIYVMNADGSHQVRLTEGSEPDWSPDGRKIAFWRFGEDDSWWGITTDVWVMDADAADSRRLMRDAAYPAWSPDGTKIAFAGGSLVKIMDTDGANVVALARGTQPDWSPDGNRIAFVDGSGDSSDIYVMDIDGTNRVRLTEHPARDLEPAWSPDGTSIAFVSDRDGDREVYLMDADGSNLLNLTNDPACRDDHPSWSPAG